MLPRLAIPPLPNHLKNGRQSALVYETAAEAAQHTSFPQSP
ncbi:hypothetical protein [Chitinophaga pinensis]|nr:hypothetical protein [Chitinophaga pinensis]